MEQDRFIKAVNKLQDVFTTVGSEAIQLPQIVVIGNQVECKENEFFFICSCIS
jgi:dynamin 1-like protein